MQKKVSDILVVGFALFAMYFGAGNLVFPPTLGAVSGNQWPIGFLGFLIAEVGLTLCGLLAITLSDGSPDKFFEGLPKWFSVFIFVAIALIIGPLFAVPRTAATTFEIAFLPVAKSSFGETGVAITGVITKLLFFAVTLIFVITPSNVIDKIGKFLTPFLLIALTFLILKGIFVPLGKLNPPAADAHVFAYGVRQGYQTMDALGTLLFGVMLINTMREKGYSEKKPLFRMSIIASLVACLGLALVYGGLTYLGASANDVIPLETERTTRLVLLAQDLWGPIGSVILGFSISLACLTTSIGLIAPVSEYFSKLTKIPVKVMAVIATLLSFGISLIGVEGIINVAGPLLEILYPIIIVLIFMAFLAKVLPNFWFKRGAVIGTLTVSIMTALLACDASFGTNFKATFINDIVSALPFAQLGFAWVLPALVCGILAGGIAIPLTKKQA